MTNTPKEVTHYFNDEDGCVEVELATTLVAEGVTSVMTTVEDGHGGLTEAVSIIGPDGKTIATVIPFLPLT